jgi:serine/threonine protein kinase
MEHVHASSTSPPADSNGLRRQSSLASNPSQTEHTTEDVFNWRHGDIKPDNILRFLSSRPNQQTAQFSRIGTWKLADLGRAKANYDATMNRQNESENEMFATMYYEPPDLHLKHADGKPRHISRLFDIWSIGCVAWETVLWLVYGLSSVNKFVKDSVEGNTIRGFSKSTPYWAKRSHENHRAQRSPVLEHWFDLFLGFEEEQSSAIRDLVEVLKKKVFIVELHKNSLKYYTGYRTNAEDLLLELNKIIRRGEDDSDPYWYRGFDYCSAERLERSRVRPTAVLEASHNNGLWKSDSRLDAPAISPGQATAIAMGDEYTHPFNNTWIHELDDDDQDDCAIKHLYAFPPSYEKLKSRHVCEHCKGFTTLGEELKISREVLDVNVYESDLVCGLCQMIEEALETSLQGELTFMRSVAGIQLKGRERPVVRICQTPAGMLIIILPQATFS